MSYADTWEILPPRPVDSIGGFPKSAKARAHSRRLMWVDGDPNLKRWHQQSGLQVDKFIRKNKAEIDLMIEKLEAELLDSSAASAQRR